MKKYFAYVDNCGIVDENSVGVSEQHLKEKILKESEK